MRIINETKQRLEVFDTFGEFIRLAEKNPKPQASDRRGDTKWSKTESLSEASSLAHNGWNEIRPQVDSVLNDLTDRLSERLSSYYVTEFATSGASVDMGRFITGEPECMVEWSPVPEASMGRVVKIVIAGTVSSDIAPELIIRRGIAVLSLVDTIHKMGVGIELWWDSSIMGSDRTNKTHTTAVKLHDSSEPLDIDSVMFALAHPSMLRRLTFSVQEQSETADAQNVGCGYGRCADMGLPLVEDFDVIVERLQSGHGDIVKDPMAWVMTTVQGLGLVEEGV